LLAVDNVSCQFGQLKAVDQVTLRVNEGSITGLIGPNGAGKTTLFSIIAGALRADAGRISLAGSEIGGLRPDQIYRHGLGRTFQIPRLFAGMSVLENVMTAPLAQTGESFWANWFQRGAVRRQERQWQARAMEIIDFVNLGEVAHDPAATLSGGQMKLLELARVLIGEPRIILLDEPGAGINPALLQVLVEKIAEINKGGVTFLIIEHNMDLVMRLCEPVIAMAQGRIVFEGSAEAARRDPTLLDIYLGDLAA